MNSKKINCIAAPSILFTFTQNFILYLLPIIFFLILFIAINTIKNKVQHKKITTPLFWWISLFTISLFLFVLFADPPFSFYNYLSGYVIFFLSLLVGLLLAKKYKLFKVSKITIIITLLLLILSFILFTLKGGAKKDELSLEKDTTNAIEYYGCGSESWY